MTNHHISFHFGNFRYFIYVLLFLDLIGDFYYISFVFFFSESYFWCFRNIQNDLKIGGFQPYLLVFFVVFFHTEAVHCSLAGLYYFVIAFYSKSAKSTLELYDIILRTKYPSKS